MSGVIRWGILGTGDIAHSFAEGLKALPDAQLLAVGSRTEAGAQEFAAEFGVPRAYGSYEALVGDKDVDVVYISTPNHVHKDNARLVLEAGKAVLCEKPFMMDAAETREVIALARSKRLFCMEAMWMRFLPIMARLRGLLDEGAIGEAQMLTAAFGFPAPYDPKNRFFDPAMGGGAWYDIGIYPLSLAFFLWGAPESVTSRAAIGATGVDEQSVVVLGYPQGKMAILSASLKTYLPTEALIAGTRGQLRLHPPLYRSNRLSLTSFPGPEAASERSARKRFAALRRNPLARALYQPLKKALALVRGGGQGDIVVPYTGNGYNYEAAEVMRCLRGGELESKIMPLDETLRIMETMDAIRQQWVTSDANRQEAKAQPEQGGQ